MDIAKPYLLFLGDVKDQLAAKTAQGVVDWRARGWRVDAVRSGAFDVVVANISEIVIGELKADFERVAPRRILSGFQDIRGEWTCVTL